MCVIFDEINKFDLDFHQNAPIEVALILNVNMYQQMIICMRKHIPAYMDTFNRYERTTTISTFKSSSVCKE